MKLNIVKILCVGAMLLPAPGSARSHPIDGTGAVLSVLNIKGMPFRQFAAMLSRGTGCRIVVGSAAGEIPVHLYLEDVDVSAAMEGACRACQCWYKRDPDTGITCVITLDEYKQGLTLHDDEIVRVFKLRHIDARLVGDSLHRLYRDRLIWERPDDEDDDGVEDLEQALERMDTLADRAQFSQGSMQGGGSSSRNVSSRSDRYLGGRSGSYDRSGRYSGSRSSGYGTSSSDPDLMKDVELEVAPEALMGQLTGEGAGLDGRVQRPGVVFVSVLRSTNTLIVRTTDNRVMDQIIALLEKLDTPRAQVLLEVKVLEIKLDDEQERGVDWLFQNNDLAGGRSTGLPGDTFGNDYGRIQLPDSDFVPQGTALDPRATMFQVVSDHVVARLQLLEETGAVTRLATPNLCVADDEVSRIFIGTQTSILTDVRVTTYTYAGDTTTTDESIDPETERRDIGTTLLITPQIHSDRSVTIRVVHEDSLLGNLTEIEYGTQQSFKSRDVETRSVVSTIVATDGEISAVGGLIREQTEKTESGLPGLMHIPYVGELFKSTRDARSRSELLVLLRPFILRGPGDAEPVARDLMRRLSRHPSARDDIPSMGVYDGEKGGKANTEARESLMQSLQPRETE